MLFPKEDTIPPVCVGLPESALETVELGVSGSIVSWTAPTCSDRSQTAVVTSSTRSPGSFFIVGTVNVTYTCTDASGNSGTCTFPVIVNTSKNLNFMDTLN